jgi:hypothetical protein
LKKKQYWRKIKLRQSVIKSKRKSEENEWKWEGKKIEQVSEFKYLGYTFKERATDKAHTRDIVRKANKVVGCVWGIGEKVGRWFQEENDDVWEHGRERIDVRGRDLGMEGKRGGRESARKIFEVGARSG